MYFLLRTNYDLKFIWWYETSIKCQRLNTKTWNRNKQKNWYLLQLLFNLKSFEISYLKLCGTSAKEAKIQYMRDDRQKRESKRHLIKRLAEINMSFYHIVLNYYYTCTCACKPLSVQLHPEYENEQTKIWVVINHIDIYIENKNHEENCCVIWKLKLVYPFPILWLKENCSVQEKRGEQHDLAQLPFLFLNDRISFFCGGVANLENFNETVKNEKKKLNTLRTEITIANDYYWNCMPFWLL